MHNLFHNNSASKPAHVEFIAETDLCIGCGVCEAACPNGAVRIVFSRKRGIPVPTVDEKLCNGCQVCLNVCYGYKVDKDLNVRIFRTYPRTILGNLKGCYVGYACDERFRRNCTSGGVVSAILVHAFARRLIDGAIVTRMEAGNPPKAKAFIAATIEEVFSARGSKYCPVSFEKCLKNLERGKKYAVVGLPCHLYGIRRLAEFNAQIKNSVSLYIGILCGGMPSYLGTRYILRSHNMEKLCITKFEYRGEGWPGRLLVQGRQPLSNLPVEIRIPYPEYWHNTFGFFVPFRCTLCHDGFNELSDISFGDAWFPAFRNSRNGLSLIIARTDLGKHLLHEVIEGKLVQVDSIDSEDAIKSQRGLTYFKSRTLRARFNLCKSFQRKLPVFDLSRSPSAGFDDYLFGISLYLGRILASNQALWWLLKIYASTDSFLDFFKNYMARVKDRIGSIMPY